MIKWYIIIKKKKILKKKRFAVLWKFCFRLSHRNEMFEVCFIEQFPISNRKIQYLLIYIHCEYMYYKKHYHIFRIFFVKHCRYHELIVKVIYCWITNTFFLFFSFCFSFNFFIRSLSVFISWSYYSLLLDNDRPDNLNRGRR